MVNLLFEVGLPLCCLPSFITPRLYAKMSWCATKSAQLIR